MILNYMKGGVHDALRVLVLFIENTLKVNGNADGWGMSREMEKECW